MELKMSPYQLPEAISFNFEELKAGLLEKTKVYEAMVYTEEQITAAKADRANLNRLKKALNDERLKREREYMQPFMQFKAQVAEIISIIDRPVMVIDKQVKAFEDQKREAKQQQIMDYWAEKEAPAWMQVIDIKWLNASVSMKSIKAEIDSIIEQREKDLAVIRALPAYAFEAEEQYKRIPDLAEAVKEAHRLSEIAERKAAYEAEQAKRKEEAAAQQPEEIKQAPAPESKKYSLSFRCTLTVEQARELRDFFHSRNIPYEKI